MVIDIVFGGVLLAVIAALVLLFAMLGELATRTPADQQTVRGLDVRPIEEARLGVEPQAWPAPLAGISDTAGQTIVLVLSTVCSTCNDVAGQVAAERNVGLGDDLAIVVSTGDLERAEAFLDTYGIGGLRHHIDVSGDWVGREFGVRVSPAALVFHAGRLQSAFIFQDLNALRAAVSEPKGVA